MADSRKSRGSGRRRTTRRESSRSGAALQEDRGDGLQSVLARWAETAAVALLVARILIPTEGAVQGDTLWIALLWFPLAALWLIVHPASGGPSASSPATRSGSWWRGSSFRLADAGVLLLAAGHVFATGGVFALGGNRRSAVNLTWEWVALAVTWFVLKSMLARRGFRRQLVVVLVALAVAESGYGIWQHYVWYPQTARLYSGIRTELDELESRTGLTSTEEARRNTLQGQLMERQIPLEGPSRLLWENRLNASTEPFGTFALANSFAGYLGGWLFVALGFAVVPLLPFALPAGSAGFRGGQSRTTGSIAVSLVIVVPLLLCLLLTKSRTAWAGSSCAALLVAVAAWLLWKRQASAAVVPAGANSADAAALRPDSAGSARQMKPHSGERIPAAVKADEEVTGTDATADAGPASEAGHSAATSPKRNRLALAVAAFVLLAGVVAGLASLDAKVLSEAPRSVRFRLQYWHGAVQVIREHPLLGVGPGNFRQHYLTHKLPESSEEIADPHNLILDIWASAGLTALAGLLLLLAALGNWCWRTGRLLWKTPAESARWCAAVHYTSTSSAGSPTGAGRPVLSFSSGIVGGCAGFLLVLLSTELTGGGTEPASWLMAAGWIGMLFVLKNRSNPAGLLCVGSLAGAVALTVHLCGAGGIEMPAIVETLLVLLLLGRCLLVEHLERFTENSLSAGRPGEDSARGAHLASEGGSWNANDGGNEKRGWLIAGTVGCFVLAVLCWSMAAGPEWQRRIETVLGDAELMQTGRVDVAEQHYRRAAVLDPLSPEPVVRLAELAFRRWQSAPDLNEHRFDEAVKLQELAIRQDPAGPGGYRRLGEYWLARARHSGLTEHAAASVRAYQEAIERYPAYALLRADYAVALAAAGEEQAAREEAAEALRLNKINRQEGHTDKLLDTERLNALESLPDEAVLP